MSNNLSKVARTTVTRDLPELDKETGNIYESIAILGKRADQISLKIKEELSAKLEEFANSGENLEEVYENREQIELSKYYERHPGADRGQVVLAQRRGGESFLDRSLRPWTRPPRSTARSSWVSVAVLRPINRPIWCAAW
jgi:hypothetical protein